MPHIAIISSSVRSGRNSHRASLFFKNYLERNKLATAGILDLNAYQFPIFEERLKYQKDPDAKTLDFAEKFRQADGIIIVTPEYNGGYPASLKNVIDLLTVEWKRKPVAIVTASEGAFAGTQVITSLQFSLWKMGAWTVPARFHIPFVQNAFDEKGEASDQDATDQKASKFIEELLWCVEAGKRMEDK